MVCLLVPPDTEVKRLLVYVSTVTDGDHENDEPVVLNFADDAMVTDPESPIRGETPR
jgi:hypothetical protein